MKYCKNCGELIKENSKYCLKCGTIHNITTAHKINETSKVGFIISIISIVTCGITSLISLIVSIVGMCTCSIEDKKGRSYALSGIIISIVMLVFVMFLLVLGTFGDTEEISTSGNKPVQNERISKSQQEETIPQQKQEEKVPNSKKEVKEYLAVDIDELEDALENNAAAAQEAYKGKYLQITGRLGVIDSDLKYISLLSTTDDWDLIGVTCYIKNFETKEVVKSLSKDQTIVVKGKITRVGEVFGYYMNIDEIIPQ